MSKPSSSTPDARSRMPEIPRYYAAACQTDLPCPRDRDAIPERVGHLLGMIDRAVVGYEPFFDVKLVVFPEFAHAAPIYETADELIDRLAVPIPNEHTDRYVQQGAGAGGLHPDRARSWRSIRRWPGVGVQHDLPDRPRRAPEPVSQGQSRGCRGRSTPARTTWPATTSRCSRSSRPRSAGWARRSATTGCSPRRSARWRWAGRRS